MGDSREIPYIIPSMVDIPVKFIQAARTCAVVSAPKKSLNAL